MFHLNCESNPIFQVFGSPVLWQWPSGLLSHTTGWLTKAKCARIWCRRPVPRLMSSKVVAFTKCEVQKASRVGSLKKQITNPLLKKINIKHNIHQVFPIFSCSKFYEFSNLGLSWSSNCWFQKISAPGSAARPKLHTAGRSCWASHVHNDWARDLHPAIWCKNEKWSSWETSYCICIIVEHIFETIKFWLFKIILLGFIILCHFIVQSPSLPSMWRVHGCRAESDWENHGRAPSNLVGYDR